jgi:hypothetical protein
MSHTNIQISSVRCRKCGMEHSLDENHLCPFCRRDAPTEEPENNGTVLALAILLAITIGITLLARI